MLFRSRDRETERQRDRETERQKDRETERQRDRGPAALPHKFAGPGRARPGGRPAARPRYIADLGVRQFDIEPLTGSNCELRIYRIYENIRTRCQKSCSCKNELIRQ